VGGYTTCPLFIKYYSMITSYRASLLEVIKILPKESMMQVLRGLFYNNPHHHLTGERLTIPYITQDLWARNFHLSESEVDFIADTYNVRHLHHFVDPCGWGRLPTDKGGEYEDYFDKIKGEYFDPSCDKYLEYLNSPDRQDDPPFTIADVMLEALTPEEIGQFFYIAFSNSKIGGRVDNYLYRRIGGRWEGSGDTYRAVSGIGSRLKDSVFSGECTLNVLNKDIIRSLCNKVDEYYEDAKKIIEQI
jgi:hypothetical protein